MVNDATLALLPPGAIVVNTARGAVVAPWRCCVPSRAILTGAGIDVLENGAASDDDTLTSGLARSVPSCAFDRLILNPHSAFYTEAGLRDMRVKGSENVRRVVRVVRNADAVS